MSDFYLCSFLLDDHDHAYDRTEMGQGAASKTPEC